MKNSAFFRKTSILLVPISLGVGLLFGLSPKGAIQARGYSLATLPTTIDLNDTSEADVRSYYASLNSKSSSERQGTNLLKNLKTILKNNQKYYSYDSTSAIWDLYCIVDRDWELSPASALPAAAGTYNASTNKITGYNWGGNSSTYENPYLHALYYNRDKSNVVQAYGDHSQTTVTGINREHIWPKGAGFETNGAGGARGDIMHLWPANGKTNNIHSNNYYGNVDTSKSYTDLGDTFSICSGNLSGTSKTFGTGTVFEPQDSDKGDIARAVFYMAARYNYYSGSDSDGIDSNNPNLELVNDITSFSNSGYPSTTSTTGKLGIIQDLLEWNRLDPPDEFEIHRNNLCYTNFTNNRNPFIDFPEWAEYVWGKTENGSYSSTATGYATPSNDTLNDFDSGSQSVSVTGVSLNKNSISLSVGDTETLVATVLPNNATNQSVSWTSSNNNVATVSGGTITGVGVGSATITVATADGGFTATCNVSVTAASIAVSLDSNSETLDVGGSVTLSSTVLPSSTQNKTVTWSSSDTSVATVSNGVVTAVSNGSATITATSNADNTKSASCTITVNEYVTLDYTNSPFQNTSASSNVETTNVFGINYQSRYGMKYTTDTSIEFAKNTAAYLGNATEYGKSIEKLVINWKKYENSSLLSVYEGTTSLPSTTEVAGSSSGLVTTYNFNQTDSTFFKIQVIGTKYYTNFSSIEVHFRDSSTPSKTLSSIAVKTAPTKTSYTEGEYFNPAGLVITKTYSDSSTEDASYASESANFTFTPSTSTALTVSNTSVTITYGGKSTSQAITVSASGGSGGSSGTQRIVSNAGSTYYTAGSIYPEGDGSEATADCDAFSVSWLKGSTSADIVYDKNEMRIYKNHSFSITPKANYTITSIVLDINDSDSTYVDVLGGSDLTNCTKAVDNLTVTLTPTDGTTTISFTNSKQARVNYIEVNYDYFVATQYSLVTDADDLRTGDEIIFVGGSYKAANTLNTTNQVLPATSVTYNSGEITSSADTEVFSVVRSGSSLNFKNKDNNYLASVGKSGYYTKYEDEVTVNSTFTLSISSGKITMAAQCSSYKYFRFNSSNSWFSFYSTSTYASNAYVYKKSTQVAADEWSKTFLSSTSNGTTCNVDNWSSLETSYDSLNSNVKQEIVTVEAQESTDYSYRAQAMARYDFFMSDSRFNNVSHFITGRTTSAIKPSTPLDNLSEDAEIFVLIACIVCVGGSVGVLLVFKRKKSA